MKAMIKLDEVIQKFRMEVGPVFISTDVVGMDGISIGGGSIVPNFDNTEASARGSMAVNLAVKVNEKLQMGDFEDLLMTSDKVYFLVIMLSSSYWWGVAVARQATLGNVRVIMKEYAPQILEAIPH
jgi:predicted regulator of Ras-like GTPase activity (Roadblock/LC7/MglB family)